MLERFRPLEAEEVGAPKSVLPFCSRVRLDSDQSGPKSETTESANPGVVAFSAEELSRIMDSCQDERLKTFMLVMRFSGLAIGDAVQFRPARLDGEHLP